MHHAHHELQARAEELLKTLRIARAMLQADRMVELGGLTDQVGLLCAKAVDLAPDDGRNFRPFVAMILAEVEAMTSTLHRAHIDIMLQPDRDATHHLLS